MPDNFWDHPLGPDLRPVSRTPALDFLRKVEVWQQPGTGSIPISMPSGDAKTLRQLLKDFRREGAYPGLEEQARNWLIGYRELSPMLSEEQSTQLDVAIDGRPKLVPPQLPKQFSWPRFQRSFVLELIAIFVVCVLVGAGLAWFAVASGSPANPVQTGSQSQPRQPQQQVPAGTTDLENLEADWGPWRELPVSQQNPQSGAPALLLLNQGGYYASEYWTVPVDRTWAPDLTGGVPGVDVQGTHALITDADGNPWTVTISQPFVFASSPGTILVVTPAGDVLSTTIAHATSVRIRYHI